MKLLRLAVVLLPLAGCSDGTDQPGAAGSPAASAPPPNEASAAQSPVPDAEGFVPVRMDDMEFYAIGKGEAGGVSMNSTDTGFVFRGNVRNYAYTRKPYKNFTLRFEYRWPNAAALPEAERQDANTGVLVFITGEHKIWPRCLEVQGKWSEMGHIKSNAKDVTVTVRDDAAARERARKPAGEWNAVEVVAKDGALTSTLNGVKIAESDPTDLREGPIGFQAERFEVEFRNVRVREE